MQSAFFKLAFAVNFNGIIIIYNYRHDGLRSRYVTSNSQPSQTILNDHYDEVFIDNEQML